MAAIKPQKKAAKISGLINKIKIEGAYKLTR